MIYHLLLSFTQITSTQQPLIPPFQLIQSQNLSHEASQTKKPTFIRTQGFHATLIGNCFTLQFVKDKYKHLTIKIAAFLFLLNYHVLYIPSKHLPLQLPKKSLHLTQPSIIILPREQRMSITSTSLLPQLAYPIIFSCGYGEQPKKTYFQ